MTKKEKLIYVIIVVVNATTLMLIKYYLWLPLILINTQLSQFDLHCICPYFTTIWTIWVVLFAHHTAWLT